jgi:hypothetical protein
MVYQLHCLVESKKYNMKNILIVAGIAGIASAIAIYFMTESNKDSNVETYVSNNDVEAYDYIENTGRPTIM